MTDSRKVRVNVVSPNHAIAGDGDFVVYIAGTRRTDQSLAIICDGLSAGAEDGTLTDTEFFEIWSGMTVALAEMRNLPETYQRIMAASVEKIQVMLAMGRSVGAIDGRARPIDVDEYEKLRADDD